MRSPIDINLNPAMLPDGGANAELEISFGHNPDGTEVEFRTLVFKTITGVGISFGPMPLPVWESILKYLNNPDEESERQRARASIITPGGVR